MKSEGVSVRWVKGFGERVVDGLVWDAENGFVVVVSDPVMVERLLGNGDFEVVQEQDVVNSDGTE